MEDTLSAINGRSRRLEAMYGPLAQRAFTPALFYPGLSRPGLPLLFCKTASCREGGLSPFMPRKIYAHSANKNHPAESSSSLK